MKDRISHSNQESINPKELEVRTDVIMIKEDTKEDLGPTMCTEVIQDVIKIIEVVMDIMHEVIKCMEDIIMIITEEVVIEVKIMIGIGVGHMKDRIETEETVEAQVTD